MIKLIKVPAGTFTMGTRKYDPNRYVQESPAHTVTLSAFEIGETPVSQAQWQTVMGSNPSACTTAQLQRNYNFLERFGRDPGPYPLPGEQDQAPVERVSWYDAVVFCNRLSEAQGLTPCYYNEPSRRTVFGKIGETWHLPGGGDVYRNPSANGYRLPTEAEWEYAARGGASSQGYKYAGSNSLDEVAWYDGNSGNETHPGGQKKANELGLYDMSGNVWEWCQDWYGTYPSDEQTDPQGPYEGTRKVIRGGSFRSSPSSCIYTVRETQDPHYRREQNIGFRLAKNC